MNIKKFSLFIFGFFCCIFSSDTIKPVSLKDIYSGLKEKNQGDSYIAHRNMYIVLFIRIYSFVKCFPYSKITQNFLKLQEHFDEKTNKTTESTIKGKTETLLEIFGIQRETLSTTEKNIYLLITCFNKALYEETLLLYQKFCILIDEQDNSSELLKNIPSDDYEEKIYQLLLHGKNFFGLDRNVFHNDKKNYLINYVNIIKKNFTDIKKNIVHMITNNILINDPEFEALPIELIQKHLFKNNFALFAHTFITDQLEPAAKGKIPFALFLKNQIIYCNQNLSQVLGQPGKDFIKDNKNLLIHDFISYCKVLAVEDNILIKIKDNAEYKKVVDFLSYYAFGIYCEEVKKGFRKKIDELKEIPPSFEAMAVIHKNLLEKNLRCEGYRIFEACYGYKRSKNL